MHVRKQTEQYAENTEITPPPLPRKKRNIIRKRRNDSHLRAVPQDTEKSEVPVPLADDEQKFSKAELNIPKVFELEHLDESAAQEDSVLLKALKLRRNPLERLAHSTSTLGAQLGPKVREFRRQVSPMLGAVRDKLKMEVLRNRTPKQQAILGAAVAITMFFVGFSLVSSSGENEKSTTNVASAPAPLQLDDVPINYHPPEKIAPEKKTQVTETKQEVETTAALAPIAIEPTPVATPQRADSVEIIYTRRPTWLRSKTSKKAIKVLRLPKNARLTKHSGFATKDGWVLATTQRGHVGFVMTKYLKQPTSKR